MRNNKLIFLFFIILSLIISKPLFAEENVINSVVDVGDVFKVLVMPNKACLWRSIEISPADLKQGLNFIQVKNIPVEADINSFQVSVSENLRSLVSVEGVDVFLHHGSKEKALKDNISSLELKKQNLLTELNVCEFKLSFLKKTSSNVSSLAKIDQHIDSLEKLYRDQLLLQKDIKLELEELNKELLRKKTDLLGVMANGEEIRLNIKLFIKKIPEGKDKIIISYWDKRAGYNVSYNIRILPESDQVEIISSINVWQETDCDWKDVLLSLSLDNSVIDTKEFIDKKDTLIAGDKGNSYFFDNSIYSAILKYDKDINYPGQMLLKAQITNTNNYAFMRGQAKVFYGGNYTGKIDFGPCGVGKEYVISFLYQDIDAVSKKTGKLEKKEW